MIFPKGYMLLAEIADECLTDNRHMHEVQVPFDPNKPDANYSDWVKWIDYASFSEGIQRAWSFCDQDEFLPYTMLTNGTVMRISQQLMRNWGIDPVGTFIDITVGTLGSGSGHYEWKSFRESGEEVDISTIEQFVGPFMGLPVLYREKVANDFLAKLGNWEGSPDAPNHDQIARAIVDAFDKDMRMTKREARKRLAPKMKHTEFLATWDLAVQQRPELSKPGPKKMR
jgi:hypothetical protein